MYLSYTIAIMVGIYLGLARPNSVQPLRSVSGITANKSCDSIEVNSGRIYDSTIEGSPTKIGHRYAIFRAEEKRYEIYFNLDIQVPEPHQKNIDRDHQATQNLRGRIENCLRSANDFLYDNEGTKVNLKIWSRANEVTPEPPPIRIRLVPNNVANFSIQYKTDISCGTLVHELFHLAGLVDEYDEWRSKEFIHSSFFSEELASAQKGSPAFECRIKGYDQSIMADYARLDFTISQLEKGYEILGFCTCDIAEAECLAKERAKLAKTKFPTACPAGFLRDQPNQSAAKILFPDSNQNAKMNIPSHQSGFYLLRKLLRADIKPLPFLKPAHLRHLIHPNCEQFNESYYACARFAYLSSKDGPQGKCPTLPVECNPQSWLD